MLDNVLSCAGTPDKFCKLSVQLFAKRRMLCLMFAMALNGRIYRCVFENFKLCHQYFEDLMNLSSTSCNFDANILSTDRVQR